MIRKSFHALLLFAVLFATWYVFSGIRTPQFLLFGAISSAIAALLALRMQVVDQEGHPFHLTLTAPIYWLWLAKEMIKSGLAVTRLVWTPENNATPSFAWLPISQNCDLGRTIYANSITLTPGTVCVDIEHKRVFVHALEESSIDELKDGGMNNRVARLTRSKHHHTPKQQTKN